LALYESRNGELPESLSQLADYGVSKEALNQAESALTYTRPDKDAPPDTVILQTKQMDFIEGATMKIEVTKDLNARQITTAPLNRR
jgi:hypothetical protein